MIITERKQGQDNWGVARCIDCLDGFGRIVGYIPVQPEALNVVEQSVLEGAAQFHEKLVGDHTIHVTIYERGGDTHGS